MAFYSTPAFKRLEMVFTGAAVTALAALLAGQAAQQFAERGDFPTLAALRAPLQGAAANRGVALDYSTTGSVKNQTIVLDPCTGQQKSK